MTNETIRKSHRQLVDELSLIDRLKLAVWMLGNVDTEEDKAQWWKNYGQLWEEISEDACKIAAKIDCQMTGRL